MQTSSTKFLAAAALATAVLPLLAGPVQAQGALRGVVRVAAEYGGDKVGEFEYSDGSTPDVVAGGGLVVTAGGVVTMFARNAHAAEAQVNLGLKYRTIPPATNQDATWLRFPLEGLFFYRMPVGVRMGAGATVHLRNVLEVSGEVANDRVEFETSPGLLLQADYIRGDWAFDLRYTALQYELTEGGSGAIDASSIGVGLSYLFGRSARSRAADRRVLPAAAPVEARAPAVVAPAGSFETPPSDAVAPARIPLGLHTILDSASLHTALAAVPDARADKRTARVFRVEFDSAGQPRPVVPAVPATMPDEYRAAVAPLIQSALRPIEPRRGGWRTLLLVKAGSMPTIAQVDLPERAPEVANARVLRQELARSAQELVAADASLVGRTLRVRVTMQLDAHGVAATSGIHASSGNRMVDEAALRALQVIRFAPALLDNEPVSAQVILPIQFVFPVEE